eukprot:scaffold6760_cov119-Isochrysis_galbana.AAC.10
MICRGGGGKGEQLAQQVPERSWRRTRKRSREGDIRDGEARGQGDDGKKRRTHVAIAASRHSERTLATWNRMLREGIT